MFIYRLESSYKFYSYDFRWYVSSLKVMALRFHIFILLLFHFFIPFTEKKNPQTNGMHLLFLLALFSSALHSTALWGPVKASGGDGIPVELFQILKDDAVKVLHSICQQI